MGSHIFVNTLKVGKIEKRRRTEKSFTTQTFIKHKTRKDIKNISSATTDKDGDLHDRKEQC